MVEQQVSSSMTLANSGVLNDVNTSYLICSGADAQERVGFLIDNNIPLGDVDDILALPASDNSESHLAFLYSLQSAV
jgi:hypothetical protein